MTIFAERLKKLREDRGITQQELAEIVGTTNKAVSTWENGIKVPRQPRIEKLADYFNVTTDYLLGRIETKQWNDVLSDTVKNQNSVESYLINLGYSVTTNIIQSDEFYEEEIKDSSGKVIGKTKIPSTEFAQYAITKNDVNIELTQTEFESLSNKLNMLTKLFIQLNEQGQNKILDNINDLLMINQYKKQ